MLNSKRNVPVGRQRFRSVNKNQKVAQAKKYENMEQDVIQNEQSSQDYPPVGNINPFR